MPRPCVRCARGRLGGFGPVPGVVSLSYPPSRPACPALRVAGRLARVSLTLARWYAIPRGLCVLRARSGCPSGSPRVPFACVCARAPAASAPRPPWVVWRAHLVRSQHWALVGPFHVVCAPPRVLPHLACLGGGGPVPVPPYLAWRCGGGGRASPGGVLSTVARGVSGQALPLPRLPAHWADCWGPLSTCCGRGRAGVGALLCPLGLHALWGLRAAGRVRGVRVPGGGPGGGGGTCAAPPVCASGGGLGGEGSLCLVPSLCLPWAGNKAGVTGVVLSMGGVAPHTTPVRAGPPSMGAICAASWRVGDGTLVLRGPCGSWRLGRGGGSRSGSSLGRGGGGTIPPASGGGGPGPRGLRAGGGGGGGRGSSHGLPAPPLGGGPRYPMLAPLVSSAHSPPACACGRGRGAAPGWGGVRGGPWTAPPGAPADLNPPSALPEWAVVTGGSCRARPPYCSGAPPCAAPKRGAPVTPARWCGLALRPRPPRGAGSWGRWGARCAGPAASPPPRRGPFWGRGGVPSAPGGPRAAPVAPKLGGGERGGGGVGGPPPRPVGRRPAICCLRRAPPGYTRAVGVAGRPRASGAVQPAANGSVRRGGGGGGGTPLPWFAPPSSPGWPLIGPLRWRRPGCRRSAVGRQRAARAGACLGCGAPAPRVQRPLRGGCGAAVSSVCLRPLLGLSERGEGEWGGPSGPLVLPSDGRGGGGMAVPAPGASHRLGGRTLPPPLST